MLSILTTLIGGGVTGLLGTAITSVLGYFKQKEENKMALALEDSRRKTLTLQANINLKMAEAKVRGAIDLEEIRQEGEARITSYENDKAAYATGDTAKNSFLFILVDFLRGIIRPGLTIYLIVLTTLTYLKADALVNAIGVDILNVDDAIAMVKEINATILYLTVVCVSWYFGNRSVEKHDAKFRGVK